MALGTGGYAVGSQVQARGLAPHGEVGGFNAKVVSHRNKVPPLDIDRVLRLAMTDNSMAVLLVDLVEQLRMEAPKLDMHVLSSRPTGMLAMLDDGEIDLAVGVASELETRHRSQPLLATRAWRGRGS